MKGVAPKVFGFAILLFCVEAFAAGGSLGGVSLPQNTGAYTIVREGDHYNITFAIELLIGEEFHQHINQEIAFHIRRRNGGVFENWENFERDPALPEDVTGGFLHIRLKLRDITEASVPLFEFRIHFDLTQLSETMTAHVEDGVFSPAVSPTLSIHATEDPCWSVDCDGGRECVEGECVCPEGRAWSAGSEACVDPSICSEHPDICARGRRDFDLGPPPLGTGSEIDTGSAGGCSLILR